MNTTKAFNYSIGELVELVESGEVGKVVGRADYQAAEDGYLVRYKSADGRQVECWWGTSALKPA